MNKKQSDFYKQFFREPDADEDDKLSIYDCVNRHERRMVMKQMKKKNRHN